MGHVFVLSLLAALNPTLVAATAVMLLLTNPMRLMLGYLCGALLTSITLGLIIVFAFADSGTANTVRTELSPTADLVLGALAFMLAIVLSRSRDLTARSRSSEDKEPPRWRRALNKGSPRTAFVVGATLTLPGASYLAALRRLSALKVSTAETVVAVIAFNLIMLALLEVPLLSFALAPKWTPMAVERAKAWVAARARRIGVIVFCGVGAALTAKGIVGLVS